MNERWDMRITSQSGFSMVEGVLALVVIGLIGYGAWYAYDQSQDDDTSSSVSENKKSETTTPKELPLNMTFSNLEPLAEGMYEAWVVQDDVKNSIGTFNMNDSGEVMGELSLGSVEPKEGDTVAISIEPENDSNPEASETIILAGEIVDGTADLAFPLDTSGFAGQYILATPTTTTTDDETAGVWFTTTGTDTSLVVDVAPAGWIYEGWAVVDGTPISTGQFTDPAQADLFDGYSGPEPGPNKPGEDFITNLPNDLEGPLDLAQGTATIVVSIEPYQDGSDPTGDGPAQVKPLSAAVEAGATDHTAYDLMYSADSLPSGSASL